VLDDSLRPVSAEPEAPSEDAIEGSLRPLSPWVEPAIADV
jgi:hypothetical protein